MIRVRFRPGHLSLAVLPLLMLSACAVPEAPPPAPEQHHAPKVSVLPPVKLFGAAHLPPVQIANADLARDFMDLTFRLESGKILSHFTRFEEPIRVSVAGDAPRGMERDLDALLARLRREAHLDIALAPEGTQGNLIVQPVSGDQIRGELAQAACFVIPNITSLDEYPAARRQGRTHWANLTERTQVAIFVPNDAAPQEMRDCLHEELAQATGPLNDLYRLPHSVFNDDNVQTILTSYDMLMLRITYAPELKSGMTQQEVAEALPAIVARLNPAGETLAPHPLAETPQAWSDAILKALGGTNSPAARLRAGREALAIAQREGWNDHRTAFAYYIMGRLTQGEDPEAGLAYLQNAHAIYTADPSLKPHAAMTAVQLASHAILNDDPEAAIALLNGRDAVAITHQNAALLAKILMLRAEALDMQGKHEAARSTRLDSLGWARYGYGPDWAVAAQLQRIAELNPRRVGE